MRPTDSTTPDGLRGRAEPRPARLRLVTDVARTPRQASSNDDTRARMDRIRTTSAEHRAWEVGAENRAAAALETFDARWVMAVRVSDALEGGRAAVLRPETRARLVTSATRMGLRPFDANMVIAIVQDAAREGQTPRDLDTVDRLMLVPGPRTEARARPGRWVLACLLFSAAWAGLLVRWLLG
ncbi:MAG: hypothetical protein IPJ41_13690 [Phycisphaerales bacterium]|nr:hypothetical protein [Phycisphaerales bacterium]